MTTGRKSLHQLVGQRSNEVVEEKEFGVELNEQLKEFLAREQTIGMIERLRGGGQAGTNPAEVAAATVTAATALTSAARDLSKDERADRIRAELAQTGIISAANERIDKAEEDRQKALRDAQAEREGRQSDAIAHQISDLRTLVQQAANARDAGNKTSMGESISEYVQGMQALTAATQALRPSTEGAPVTPLEAFTSQIQQVNVIRQLLGGEAKPQEIPLVQMLGQDGEQQTVPWKYALEIKKMDLEDLRERDMAKDALAMEERKSQAVEGLFGVLMSGATQFLDGLKSVEGSPEIGEERSGGPREEPLLTEVACDGCGKAFFIKKEDKMNSMECPFCVGKDNTSKEK